jgi:tetratricopeptide (TPR) repeat protein
MLADSDARAGRTVKAAERYSEIILTGAADRMTAAHLASVVKLLAGNGKFEAALTGAKALSVRSADPAYSQTAAAREGEALEALGRSDAAIEAYRRALSIKASTDEGAAAALALGVLEYRKGELDAAEKTLSDAVARNPGEHGAKARLSAYKTLALVCRAKGEEKKAQGYETVVKELFGE